jgi:hypothetical protein
MAVAHRFMLLEDLHKQLETGASPGTVRKTLIKAIRDLRRLRAAFNQYPTVVKDMLFWKDAQEQETFLKRLDDGIKAAQLHHDVLVVPHGSKQRDGVALAAAGHAGELLQTFSAEAPTLTRGGPFFRLASLLYEAGTGKTDANLEKYCREQFKRLSLGRA